MINLDEVIRQLTNNAEAIRALAQTISDEQATWKPDPESWSMQEVMEHLYNEERTDFKLRLKWFFGEPSQRPEYLSVESIRQALDGFLAERQASIAWLSALDAPDWNVTTLLRFGPDEAITMSAGDMLLSWVEHDILHMRQLVELRHGWNARQASPHSLRYAGEW
ncbi:MAG: DinB family protein [Chloroflexi bacterium]|jgi:hypothetical protein|nr:DinB family protein [Chloroflexota bacterium]